MGETSSAAAGSRVNRICSSCGAASKYTCPACRAELLGNARPGLLQEALCVIRFKCFPHHLSSPLQTLQTVGIPEIAQSP
eukprot:6200715-Pleurochrysis_carterae.AAC.1